ncbi:MAG: PrgI family protein [Candidatus Gastranaerophilaceae bacterium]
MADMEVHINTEVKGYKESIVLGLTLRQTLCSVLAIGTAVGIYFGFRDILGKETVSWLCLVCAAPFAVAGFFKYNGMTLEKFLYEVIYTYLFRSDLLLYKSQNWYYDVYKEGLKLEKHRKDNKIKVKVKKEKA